MGESLDQWEGEFVERAGAVGGEPVWRLCPGIVVPDGDGEEGEEEAKKGYFEVLLGGYLRP